LLCSHSPLRAAGIHRRPDGGREQDHARLLSGRNNAGTPDRRRFRRRRLERSPRDQGGRAVLDVRILQYGTFLPPSTVQVYRFTSSDATSWTLDPAGWTQDPAPIRRLTDFAWTAREIRSPHAILDGTTLRLYFVGDDLFNTNAWGIGQMTCSLVP